MNNDLFNMHTMYAYCPEDIAIRNLKFAYSSFTSSVDTEAERIQKELTNFLCTSICGIEEKSSLVLNSGSEANEIGFFLAKRKTDRRIVVASNIAHSSIGYAAKKLEYEIKTFTVDPKTYQINEGELISYLTEHGNEVAMLNVTYGTTQLGTKEDFILNKEILQLCRDKGIWLHIDAAFGAFYLHAPGDIPQEWQEIFDAADSITIDPYKFIGLPTIGVLILKYPDHRNLLDNQVTYFKGKTTALGTTRSVLPAATSLDIIQTLGLMGLKKLSEQSVQKARHIFDELKKCGAEFLSESNSIVVVIKADDESSLMTKLDALYQKGFYLSSVKIQTPKYEQYGMRIVTTPKIEMTLENIDRFLEVYKTPFH